MLLILVILSSEANCRDVFLQQRIQTNPKPFFSTPHSVKSKNESVYLCCVQFVYDTVPRMGAWLDSSFTALSVLSADEVQGDQLGRQTWRLYWKVVHVLCERCQSWYHWK